METAVQLNIVLPNVSSALAKLCDRLRASEVNINAITCTEGAEKTTVHLIVDDLETAKIVLKGWGTVTTTDVLAFKMKNKPGAIASISRQCAAAGLNIRNIYATTCGREKEAMVYVSVDDIRHALERMRSWKEGPGKVHS